MGCEKHLILFFVVIKWVACIKDTEHNKNTLLAELKEVHACPITMMSITMK
jgi:hypothetical protein